VTALARLPTAGAFGLIVVLLALGAARPACAQALEADGVPSVDAALEAARDQLKAGELDAAIGMLEALRARGGLSPETLARAHLLEGMGHALLDDDEAEPCFARALRLDRDLDPGVKQAEIRAPFEAALASLPPASEALAAGAQARTAGGGLKAGVRIELFADDLGWVAGVAIGDSTVPLSADAPVAFVALTPAEDQTAALLDADGNTLLTVGVVMGDPSMGADANAPAVVDASSEPGGDDPWFGRSRFDGERWAVGQWPWVTLAGAGVVVMGMAIAIVSGALVAVYDRGLLLPEAVDPLFRPALFVGLGAGVLILLAGGATIATDQIVRRALWRSDADGGDGAQDEASSTEALSALVGRRAWPE
jgi:hypothetical protein